MEEILTAIIQKQIEVCIDIEEAITEVSKSKSIMIKRHNLSAQLTSLQQESKKVDDMLATAYTHHLAGILDAPEFALAREKFERDKKATDIRAANVSQEAEKYDIENIKHNAFLDNFRRFKGFVKLDKELVSALIQRIEVDPLTKDVHIVLNFMDELDELKKLVEESEVLSDVCN